MTLAVGRWHVHFDGRSDVLGHICDLHRALGLSLGCAEQHEDGDCDHVQTRLCSCAKYIPCMACWTEEDLNS